MKKSNVDYCLYRQWCKFLLIMKLAGFFILIGLFAATAKTSSSQNVRLNLSMENATLKSILTEIEEKTDYYFFYKNDEIENLDRFSINVNHVSMSVLLDQLLKDKGFEYEIHDRYILIQKIGGSNSVNDFIRQQNTVSGKVTDLSGMPMPGVTVVVKGTTMGTITDVNGNYSLNSVPQDGVLVFSFVGMKTQEYQFSGQPTIDVTLVEDAIGIEEVVAIGYGTQRKADLTGAIGVVKIESIENVSLSTGNPMLALQGKVPGLYVEQTGDPNGASNRILIRGVNTLGNNDPLYIIDGVPTKRAEVFQALSPSSIVSVQVLKDASASSIYGSRASNGVIIVTTKNGSNTKGKVKVQFSSNFSVQSEKPQRYNMLNAVERGEALWQASINDRVDPAAANGEIYNFDWNGDFNSPVLNKVTSQPFVGGDTNVPSADTDWQDATYQPGYVISNDLTVTGGTESSSLLINLGYIKNTGMLKYTNYDRLTARINAQTSMADQKIRFGINTQVVSSNETLAAQDIGLALTPVLAILMPPTIPLYTSTGEYGGPLGSGYNDRNNPVAMQDLNKWDNRNRSYLFGNAFAEFEPIENLVFRTNVGVDYSMLKDKNIELSFNNGFVSRVVNSLRLYKTDFTSVTWSNTVTYKLDVGKSKFDFLLGVEAIADNFSSYTGYKEGYSVQSEDFFVLDAGTSNGNSFGTGTGSRLFSQFGKIAYNFDERFLASVTLRRDGSSRFGLDNRYGIFPAATFGWRLSEESFMDNLTSLSNLKLRIGVGRVGNQDVGDFASLGLFEPRYGATANQVDVNDHGGDFWNQYHNVGSAYSLYGADTGNLPSGFVSVQAANPLLRWENTDEVNVGVDFGLFDNKIIGAFDYFTRTTSDILIKPPVASALGEGQQQYLNGATKENKGWEFSLSYRKDINREFNYEIAAGAGHFADKITELPEEVRTAYAGNSEQTIVGHSEYSIFGYVYDGIFQNQAEVDAAAEQVGAGPGRIRYKDLNGDEVISALDQKFLGTTLPDLEYSLRINVNYKNFDLSIFGSGVAGKIGYDPYLGWNRNVNVGTNFGPGVFDAWTPTNTDTKIPALTLADPNNEGRSSDYLNVNLSYFKVRNLQLGYNIPARRLGMNLENLRVYFMADNVFWIKSKDYMGPDPERLSDTRIPVPTTLSLGVNVSF
ncbi:SusC/RagA family TonB-linked outer membrane protein [Sunxiuqinia sp. A32]|uniref:SusC/RagA family TonB-linked outer membrane protein n=1 Tax=Sunxiuqinia sp. A32 TaxID=3461496 RepID=UPI00404657C7